MAGLLLLGAGDAARASFR